MADCPYTESARFAECLFLIISSKLPLSLEFGSGTPRLR
jgi:hypothetical protein